MEEIKNGGICPLTGWKITSKVIEDNGYRYTITCGVYFFVLWVTTECWGNSALAGQQHIIRWLLFNGKIKTVENHVDKQNLEFVYSEERLFKLVEESFIPRTPKEKSDQLLVLLSVLFPAFKGEIQKDDLYKLSFFQSKGEFDIHLNYLVESNYIKIDSRSKLIGLSESQNKSVLFLTIEFKFLGIQKMALLEENGRNSKNCFIAMSFSGEKELEIKKAIFSALDKTKYHPIIINEQHFESDRTINDAIIAEIKNAKFVIADFTGQKPNVYFEAGFALGLGLPVIYCCDKTDFDTNSHFDVNHYSHILYNSSEELRKRLIDKIRAWID